MRLVPVDRTNWRDALHVRVRPEQLRFVADDQPVALVILAKAHVRPGGRDWHPYAIVDTNDVIVGLVALVGGMTDPALEVAHLVIDVETQGREHGAHAMTAILSHVRTTAPACRELSLTVHPDNTVAQRLYARAGFAPTGPGPAE